jgi:polyphosphate glucokinase
MLKTNTLSIDIGGTFIKMMVLDVKGKPLTKYTSVMTPKPATVKAVCACIATMIAGLNVKFQRVSAGFPGVVKKGVIKTAANMHPSWKGFNFQKKLHAMTRCPVRIANDADIQGLGDIRGKGVELTITFGTGVGSALFMDGKLLPNLELGHHPFQDHLTYEDLLGAAGLKKYGLVKWRKNLMKAIALWQKTFNYEKLYLGGGNARRINFKLPKDVKVSKNINGILGGIKLWE